MEKANFIMALFLEGLGIWVVFESYRLQIQTFRDPGSGLFPALLGFSLCILAVPICLSSLKEMKRVNVEAAGEKKGILNWRNVKRIAPVLAILVVYFAILEFLGFIISTLILMGGLLWLGYPGKWLRIILISSITVLLSYYIFVVFLQTPFPSGILR